MVKTGDTVPKMVCMFALEPAFAECLREELPFMDVMPDAVMLPHVKSGIKLPLWVRIFRACIQACLDVGKRDFVICSHDCLVFGFENGPIMDRVYTEIDTAKSQKIVHSTQS